MVKLRVKNSSRFSKELIREVIAFVRPSGISNFDVMVKNSKYSFVGKAYHKGSGYHCSANPFIVARIGEERKFPLKTEARKGYLPTLILSSKEGLVFVMAHELRHLWQAKHKKGKVWGSKGRFSERDADAYAIKKVREWRRKNASEMPEM